MDEIYGKLELQDKIKGICDEESEIQKFYAGQTIFLTGSTGYLGKSIVEKLLRSCPDLKRLYLLIRPKKGKSVEQRLERYFQNTIFDTLRNTTPNFEKNVVAISGDLSLEGIGLSAEDRATVIRESDIIIHNAAMVKFDENVSYILKINVLGTKQLLDLSKDCEHLKLFLYVSTAYSNCCYGLDIKERFYPPPADLKYVQDMIDADTNANGLSDEFLTSALGKWPNLYTFTKSVAESIVEEYSKKVSFSCCVYRPSIVTPSYREPVSGWGDNLNGPGAALLGYGLGIVHVGWTCYNVEDYIPVDMCTNAIIAVCWDVVVNRKDNREAVVYNNGTSTINPLILTNVISMLNKSIETKPTRKMVWYCFVILTKYYWLWVCLDKLTHFIPAILMDCLRLFQGKKTIAVSAYMRISKYFNLIYYFANGDWRIQITKLEKIWDRMNSTDSELFFCDTRQINWEDYADHYWCGFRVHILKDPMDTLDEARRKYRKLRILHYTVVSIVLLLSFYLLIGLVRFFIGMFY